MEARGDDVFADMKEGAAGVEALSADSVGKDILAVMGCGQFGFAEILGIPEPARANQKTKPQRGVIDAVLALVEIAAGTGGEIDSESDSGQRAENSASMQIPAVIRIIEIAVRREIRGGVETEFGCDELQLSS